MREGSENGRILSVQQREEGDPWQRGEHSVVGGQFSNSELNSEQRSLRINTCFGFVISSPNQVETRRSSLENGRQL